MWLLVRNVGALESQQIVLFKVRVGLCLFFVESSEERLGRQDLGLFRCPEKSSVGFCLTARTVPTSSQKQQGL